MLYRRRCNVVHGTRSAVAFSALAFRAALRAHNNSIRIFLNREPERRTLAKLLYAHEVDIVAPTTTIIYTMEIYETRNLPQWQEDDLPQSSIIATTTKCRPMLFPISKICLNVSQFGKVHDRIIRGS